MPENPKIGGLQKDERIILLHIRRGALIVGLAAVGLLLTNVFADIRPWVPFAILGVLSITVLGDVIRYVCCQREMKRLRHEQDILAHSS